MDFKEFNKGIDSLYLSYQGAVKEEIMQELEEKKELAQSEDLMNQCMAKMTIHDHDFEVQGKGAGYFSFILIDGWYRIQISKSKNKTVPPLYIKISSELLNCMGMNEVMKDVKSIVQFILSRSDKEIVSRVDLFVDFLTEKNLEGIDKKEWISRAENIHSYWKNEVFTGWTIGQGGDISARLYNKTEELKKSNKDYFKEIWKKKGWEEDQTVWRLEFQLRRKVLKELTVNAVPDLEDKVNDIWRYCTTKWLRLAVNDGSENKSRWMTDPFWLQIQAVRFTHGSFTGIGRKVDKSRVPNDKVIFLGGLGYISSYAAKNNITDMDEAIEVFSKDSHFFLTQYLKRLSQKPANSRDHFRDTVRLKMKRFNIRPEEEK